jgi:hypothetical protein
MEDAELKKINAEVKALREETLRKYKVRRLAEIEDKIDTLSQEYAKQLDDLMEWKVKIIETEHLSSESGCRSEY